MWQNHGLRFEEWAAMPRLMKLFYIASEVYELEHSEKWAGNTRPVKKKGE